MKRTVTFEKKPMSLAGRNLKLKERAPEFTVIDQNQAEVSLSRFGDTIKVITFFPSVDTDIFGSQVKEFNQRASKLPEGVKCIAISNDLPFAQRRFCQNFKIDRVTILSDYKYSSFGINYGVLIKDLNLLASGSIILDEENILSYVRIMDEITNPLDYDELMENLKEISKGVKTDTFEKVHSDNKKSPKGDLPLSEGVIKDRMLKHPNWEQIDGKSIVRQFKFKNFIQAKYFLDLLSLVSEEQAHHPSFTLDYNRLKVSLTTHSAGGLTEKDFLMAQIIDQLAE